jgi:hypothetical protein
MRALLSATLLTALAVAVPLRADDKDKKAKEGDKPAAEKPPDKFVPLGSLVGVVQSTGGSAGGLTLRVTFRYLEPNPQAQQNYLRQAQQLMARQQQILMNRNPAQRQQQMVQLVRDAERLQLSQKDLFRVKSVDKNIEVEVAEETKVRSAQPPQAFDDKGRIKRYTAKELRELKGNDKLPGFPAELADVQVGQTVLVKVARPKTPKGPDAEPEAKPKGPADRVLMAADPRLVATLIVIAGDPGAK